MKTLAISLISAAMATGVFMVAVAGQPATTNIGAELPPKLRGLLIQEMQEIQQASQQIQAAMVQGQHEIVAERAQAIHDSFIMAQQMTDEDEQILLDTLPAAFVERDQELHELSAGLADAARNEDMKEQTRLFSELINGCVACHTKYASGRFPGLDAPAR